ncbi:MAG: aminotransferase class V-fold PLP-dependent enzyme [Actinomycetota bacterium]
MFDDELLAEVRARFHHVDECPYQGPRAFFENAGGSLTLRSVVERSTELLALPDNQGRANPASAALGELITRGRADMMTMFGATSGLAIVGETGTELLGRLIRSAVLAAEGGAVIGSHLEHPATYSACRRWAEVAGLPYHQVPFDTATSVVGVDHYRPVLDEPVAVATIIHASPVTGMHVDMAAIAAEIRRRSPEAFIIVDGIQHAAHGRIDVDTYGIDGYVLSGYKFFSRHNYGVAWLSDRLAEVPHDRLDGTDRRVWELGTRDASAYATFSEVIRYLEWLGERVDPDAAAVDSRAAIEAAASAIGGQERHLVATMLHGDERLPGLARLDGVSVVGPVSSEHRSGMVSFVVDAMPSADVVAALSDDGVRAHVRKRDHYSSGILEPLGLDDCVRASVCHYNSTAEVERLLATVNRLVG